MDSRQLAGDADGDLTAPGIDVELMAMEFQVAMYAATEKMPEDLRDIYTLWATGDYSFEEMSRQFEVPIGTIRAKVQRITRFLRRELEDAKTETHVQGVL